MNCQIINPHASYPLGFPNELPLEEIEPFTQETFGSLCQRVFNLGMPYFAFSIAQLVNDKGEYSYRFYDAVSDRLRQIHKLSGSDRDPTTRLSILRRYYFAIEKPKDGTQVTKFEAHPFPSPSYFKLTSNELPLISKVDVEKYLFSALNYHIFDNNHNKQENILILKKIHTIVQFYLQNYQVLNESSLRKSHKSL